MKPANELTREQSRALLAATKRAKLESDLENMGVIDDIRRAGERSEKQASISEKPIRSESAEQQAVIKWWAIACRQHRIPERMLFAVPLQAARTARNGARMKAEGARKGTPDLFLLVARGVFHGMIIEMKAETGKLSVEQSEFLYDAGMQGYNTAVCYSAADAQAAIEKYLAFRPA